MTYRECVGALSTVSGVRHVHSAHAWALYPSGRRSCPAASRSRGNMAPPTRACRWRGTAGRWPPAGTAALWPRPDTCAPSATD
ncbi:unnamed protein product [Leptidea sinapis]|uniref:Uncharacterized protein n=1 Tax=Leptidea sinapis TaxID=189913 RepID=A0A5E4Q218_9NEOP|nr:unnamed protein product [Leptidea sinapis]